MKHIGIIAEYNPFHNGHAYQLDKVKKLYPDKNIVVIMSGNYVQRGEPAIFNKYLRTQCALSTYADIILELPLLFATSSAEYFAHAAVVALHKLGVVDTLCFGAETDNLCLLEEIAQLLVDEPDNYKYILHQELRKGNSFPKARVIALKETLENPSIDDILQQPNNILAIEYLKAIRRLHADITPVIIRRTGNSYHDAEITGFYSSATAIRNTLKTNSSELAHVMPDRALQHLQNSDVAKPLFASDFYRAIQYALWREHDSLENYLDVSNDIANTIRAIRNYPDTLEELIQMLSGKQYTTTRISRALLHILLNITKKDMENAKENEYIRYLRILGCSKNATSILKEIQRTCDIPLINKVAKAKHILSQQDYVMFTNEIHQNHLYTQLFFNKYGLTIPSEYEHSVIISK